ncbi:MAG TPA: NifB/NifX family molybdenum-iron cluster-binding protein [Candidatus Limnocylindrales bacterium]
MRLLIPTADTSGIGARLSGHFGRAPYYTVADTETGTVIVAANPSIAHDQGHEHVTAGCVPASEVFGEGGFDAVVCQGIGPGAMSQLAQAGVPVFVYDGPDVASAVSAFRERSLRTATSADRCSGACSCGGHSHKN